MSDTTGLDREMYDDEVIAALPVFRSGFDANPTEFRRHFENILRLESYPEDLPPGIDLTGLGIQLSPVLIQVAEEQERDHCTNDWLLIWLFHFTERPEEVVRSALRLFQGDQVLHEENPSWMAQLYISVGNIGGAWDCLEGFLESSHDEETLEIVRLLRPKQAQNTN